MFFRMQTPKPVLTDVLLMLAVVVAALIGMPVASVLTNLLSGGTAEVWQHLVSTVLSYNFV